MNKCAISSCYFAFSDHRYRFIRAEWFSSGMDFIFFKIPQSDFIVGFFKHRI